LGDEILIELNEEFGFVVAKWQPEIGKKVLQELKRGQPGIEDMAEGNLVLRKPLQQATNQEAFAGPDFARGHDKALPLPHAVDQTGQSFIVKRCCVIKPWVRADLKWIPLQTVELFVHLLRPLDKP
jgi:hypothetical protein